MKNINITKSKLRERLKTEYVQDIAESLGVSKSTLLKRMKLWEIPNPSIAERSANRLIGNKYGKITVVEYAGIDKHGKVLLKCICDCGNEKIINKSSLIRSLTSSCGCVKQEKLRKKHVHDLSPAYFRRCKQGAIQRNIKFTIDERYVWEIYEKQNRQCAVSGVPIKFHPNYNFSKYQTASIDRINSKKGYVKGNIQIVHKTINVIKWNLTEEELYYWINKIFKHKRIKEMDLSKVVPRNRYINQK